MQKSYTDEKFVTSNTLSASSLNTPNFIPTEKPQPLGLKGLQRYPVSNYYHSTGAMNPIKLKGILTHGILSTRAAQELGLLIDQQGSGSYNGYDYVSVGIRFGACMTIGESAFHFVIDSKNNVRAHGEPTERQVHYKVPREAIIAVQLEEGAFLDLEHPNTKLGIGNYAIGLSDYAERPLKQTNVYGQFMAVEFQYEIPNEDNLYIQKLIDEMRTISLSSDSLLEKSHKCEALGNKIEAILKKHLKICYQSKILKDTITPYDILKYYDKNIPVYDSTGKELLASNSATLDQINDDVDMAKQSNPDIFSKKIMPQLSPSGLVAFFYQPPKAQEIPSFENLSNEKTSLLPTNPYQEKQCCNIS